MFWIILFVHTVLSDVKIWKHDTVVSTKENQIQDDKNYCSGLIFPENLGAPAILDNLTVSDVVLPRYGKIYLQYNSRIILSDTSSSCIKVKTMEYRSWLNPKNWYFKELNNAVPHTNRVPCKDDDVVIKKYPAFAIMYPKIAVQIKKLTIENYTLEHDELQNLLDSTKGYFLFQNNELQPRREVISIKEDMDCYQKYGCNCQMEYKTLNEYVCNELKNDQTYRPIKKCYAPIQVIGHCEPFCGSVILMQINRQFNINLYKNLMASLPKMDTYIGRVESKNGKQYFQIVMTDSGEYTGDSNAIAEDFFKKYIEGKIEDGIKSATFFKSENPYHPESQLNNGTWIVFGTLLGCLFIFSTIFILNTNKAQEYKPLINFRNLKQRTKSTARTMREHIQPFRFARFENKEDGGLSLAGSIVSLDKNFENPMYGATASGSKTTDMESIQELEVAEELSEIPEEKNYDEHENLMTSAMENLTENIEKIEKLIEK